MFKESIALLKKIFDLYKSALALGNKAMYQRGLEIVKITDERNRILGRIAELQEEFKQSLLSEEYKCLPAQHKAQVNEMRNQVKDLEPAFKDQMIKLYRFFKPKLLEKRVDLVDFNKKNRAISAYVRSPGFGTLLN